MLSASLSVTRSLFLTSLSLPSYFVTPFLVYLCVPFLLSLTGSLYTCSFSLFLMLSVSLSLSPRLIGRGAPVAVIGWQMNDLSSLSVMCVSEQLLTNHWPRTSFWFWHEKLLNLSPGQRVLNVRHVLHVSLVNMLKGQKKGRLLWLQCSAALPIW